MQTEDLMLEQILGLCETATALVRSLTQERCLPSDADRSDATALASFSDETVA